MTSTTSTTSGLPKDTILRFLTQGGAVVAVHLGTVTGFRSFDADEQVTVSDNFWTCLGCKAGAGSAWEPGWPGDLDDVRGSANQHATTCRAMA